MLLEAKKVIRSALISVCSNCEKIRDENGNWVSYDFTEYHKAQFTHGICPACAKKLYGEFLD